MINAQEWLDTNYPKEKRSKVKKICLNEPSLEGELDLSDFTYLFGVKVYISPQVDETKLTFKKNLLKEIEIIFLDAQKYLNQKYPTKQEREKMTWLNISNQNLEGELDFSDFFVNLKELKCFDNRLTFLNLSNCFLLEEIYCSNNLLTNIILPTNSTNLKMLNLRSNNFSLNYDFSFLASYNNLRELYLGNDKYGSCLKCYQPNASEYWCHPCAEKDLKQLTGQKLVKKFVQQRTPWIPYQEFTNIQPLAEGGFSKVYKTKWIKEEEFILKSLNNSQNITLEILTEIINTKLVDNFRIVNCCGISQEPDTKNYVIVMNYKKEGNLREYLQRKGKKISLEDKIKRLGEIAIGLNHIHRQNLVHCDFHSGNILNEWRGSFVADLGLSKIADSKQEINQIFGVLPYVAPEILRGQTYTQTSDIYSFGIVSYELFANAYPYPEIENLAVAVCLGHRPNIDKISIPQLLKDLIKRCWDADPLQRPTAKELDGIIFSWCDSNNQGIKKNTSFYRQYKEIEEEYDAFSQNTPYQIHPTATTYSKMIDTKKISELSQKIEETISKSVGIDLDELEDILKNISISEEQTENQNWNNIHLSFTPELVQQWQSFDFTYQQTQDWINIGLQPTDYNFCVWLRDNKHFTPEQVLNKGNLEQLNQEFLQEQQQSQIEQPSK